MAELPASSPTIHQLRVVLRGVSPLVWRRLLVTSDTSLADLHDALQIAFDWSGEHLHRFRIHGKDYGIPSWGGMGCTEDARRIPLSHFRLRCGERFFYEYDFTAKWKFDLRLERVLPGDPSRAIPLCVAGKRAAPPEDGCGARAYLERLDRHRPPVGELLVIAEAVQRLLDANGDRQVLGDGHELREAVERVEASQKFQPERFARRPVNRQLRAIHREVLS